MKELFVINIGRQLGSGGKDIGEIIARRLGIRLYDKELLTLAVGLGVQCGTSVGGEEARRIFAKRFRRMEWILFLVIAIGGNWLIQFALPENARWIMVNGAFPAYLAACMLIRSACYLVCRFAPGRFRLPPEQTSEAEE